MNGSILLPINGSRESMCAMELAWKLGERLKMAVNAQHVINTRGALEVLGLATPGIIGSGPYVGAYESLCNSMSDIASKLEDSYIARKEGRNVTGSWFVDEGEPADAITNRGTEHDLLVLGYRPSGEPPVLKHQTIRLALAEILAQRSPSPVIVVQKPFTAISELAMIGAMDHVNTKWIRNCIRLARALKADCSLTILAGGGHEEPLTEFVRDLKEANPDFQELKMRMVCRDGSPAELADHHLRGLLGQTGCLPVISTVDVGERRITSFGETPSDLLRRLSFDALLIWPEEYCCALFDNKIAAA